MTTEFPLEGVSEFTPTKKRNQKDVDLLLEEFEPDFNLLNSQKSQKYIERLSNQKLANYKHEQNSIKKFNPLPNTSPALPLEKNNYSGSKKLETNFDEQIEELLNSTPFKNKQINDSNQLKRDIKNNPSILSQMMQMNCFSQYENTYKYPN